MIKKLVPLTLGSLLFIPLIQAACPDGKTYKVSLTFDDGPHMALTPKVLDTLKEENVPGTFFVLGSNLAGGKSNPANKKKFEILDRMKAEGHYIGSHTYNHIEHNSSALSKEAVQENIMKSSALIEDYLSPILRLPYGAGSFRSSNPTTQARNDMVMSTVKEAGFKHVGWHIDTEDWKVSARSTLVPRMLKQICQNKGGIVLFHDIQANTVTNLKSWIQAIKAEGHELVGMENFIPEVKGPFPPENCDLDSGGKPVLINDLEKDVKKVIKKINQE